VCALCALDVGAGFSGVVEESVSVDVGEVACAPPGTTGVVTERLAGGAAATLESLPTTVTAVVATYAPLRAVTEKFPSVDAVNKPEVEIFPPPVTDHVIAGEAIGFENWSKTLETEY